MKSIKTAILNDISNINKWAMGDCFPIKCQEKLDYEGYVAQMW